MNIFTKDEVKKNTLKFFNNDELATTVWMSKYALKNAEGEFVEKDPTERYRAISEEIIRMDEQYNHKNPLTVDMIMSLLLEKKFLFGGSILFGAANPYSMVSLSNCFVISGNKEDSYGSIFRNDQEIAQISKRRGGTGLDVSHLRPKYTYVNNAANTSTGPVSFCDRFSNTTREVAQDGRRGALMLSMHVNHPDILDFITMKDNGDKVTGANVSVKVTDEFMQAVENDDIHQLRFPVDAPYLDSILKTNLLVMHTGPSGSKHINIPAREIFNKLVEVNHRRAEPGILFWDTIKQNSPADEYEDFQTESTNPCGELPLSPYDSCRLSSINLPAFVTDPFTKKADFNSYTFLHTVNLVTRVMDNIVDLEIEKIEAILNKIRLDPEGLDTKSSEWALWIKILHAAKTGRRLGISLIGHGDCVAMLGMKYGSFTADEFLENTHQMAIRSMYLQSIALAEVRGAFPVYQKDNAGNFISSLGGDTFDRPRRNIALSTIPPSGSLSILLDNQSSGIEPVFALWYDRKRKVSDDEDYDFVDATGDKFVTYHVFHPNFIKWAEINVISKEELEKDPKKYAKKSPYYGCTATEINPMDKIIMQGRIQKWVDHSISSTINLKKEATVKDVETIYTEAWKHGLKGITVYREGSRSGILSTEAVQKTIDEFEQHDAPKRPKELECDIYHPSISGEKYIVMIGLMNDKPYEVFALKKNGGFDISTSITKGIIKKQKSKHWKLLTTEGEVLVEDILEQFTVPEHEFATKMISTALRHGAATDFVVSQLRDTDGLITDYAKVIARQLKKYTNGLSKVKEAPCPSCGQTMKVEGGCSTCINPECGHSACG